ncbi:MAG: phosphopantetheine adenylyltransferase [Candidatus Bathyarchaeia archaeon]
MSKRKSQPVRFGMVALGGTFDVLHKGHRRLLRQAFKIGRRVTIGISSDDFARTLHKPHKVDPFLVRKRELRKLLSRWRVLRRARIVELNNRYGPTVTTSKVQALVVSRRTIRTAYEINSKRRSKRIRPLEIVPIDLILADDRRPISSTRIRRGRIDREGRIR